MPPPEIDRSRRVTSPIRIPMSKGGIADNASRTTSPTEFEQRGLVALGGHLGISSRRLLGRSKLFAFQNARCAYVDLQGLGFHDGSALPYCYHGGVITSPEGALSYHGTRRFKAILDTKTLMAADTRTLQNCDGFHHNF